MQVLDWLVVATVGAIALVLLDGFRRKWSERRNRVVMKLDRNVPQDDINPDEIPNSELPNGGARTLRRDTDEVPAPRKRNFGLKDGRDKRSVREAGSSDELALAQSVPVLMDPVEVDENAIEHANVFVTADTVTSAGTDDLDDELPPEVLAGLDNDDAEDTTPPHDATQDALDETGLIDELADQFVTANTDPLLSGYGSDDEYLPGEPDDYVADPEEEAAPIDELQDDNADEIVEHDAGVDADAELHADMLADEDDIYTGEDDYENEPALLENAYRLAASHFQRPPVPVEPRIEPGFGDAPADTDIDATDGFAAPLNEGEMDAFIQDEQEEIRAWRNQSVTQQQDATKAATESLRVSPTTPVAVSAVVAPAVTRDADLPVEPAKESISERVEVKPVSVAAEVAPVVVTNAESVASVANATPKPNRPGFWESVASKAVGNVGRVASKIATAKTNQGELFQEDSPPIVAAEEPVVESGPQEVIVINVMAKAGQYFYGDELFPVLQQYGLRLGSMNIFHRHTETDGNGPIIFSMANMVKPGTFSLAAMETLVTPGISFFVQLPNRQGNMQAFDLMLATANSIKHALDGDLKDERRSVLTRQTVEHCRQRIRDFELSQLSKK